MSHLGQVIRQVQRDAAGMSVTELRDEIAHAICCPLDEALVRLEDVRPGVSPDVEYVNAVSDLMTAVLIVALYVRELTHRPLVWADISSPNLAGTRKAGARRTLTPPGPAGAAKQPPINAQPITGRKLRHAQV